MSVMFPAQENQKLPNFVDISNKLMSIWDNLAFHMYLVHSALPFIPACDSDLCIKSDKNIH